MKKATLIMGALALVLGLSQCRKPNAPAINGGNGTQHVVLQASFDNGGSKIAENGIGGIKWATGDEITVRQGGVALEPGTLTCTDAENGIFTGEIATTSGDITFTFGEQNFESQTGTLDGAISLSSGDVAYNPSGSYTDVQMTMPYAVLKLDLSAFGTATPGTTVTISAGGSVVASVTGVKTDSKDVYVAMPAAASREYTFSGGGKTGKATWVLAANTFYTKSGSSTGEAIEIIPDVESPKFSVSADKTVEFSPGNLYWDGSEFKFEANQWDYRTWEGKQCYISGTPATTATPTNHCGLFKWSDAADAVTGEYGCSGELFCTSDFEVEGETWFTLSNDEWRYLLGISDAPSPRDNASSLRGWGTVAGVPGLVILPDNTENPSDVLSGITTAAGLAAAGAVFLPAAGYRFGTIVGYVGSDGNYWSSTPHEEFEDYACRMYFGSGTVSTNGSDRGSGYAVRLVRSGS